MELTVTGVHCAGCGQRAAAAVRRLRGVLEASTDHATGRVQVVYDSTRLQTERITEQLAAAGFPAIGPPPEAAETGTPR